MENKDTNLAEAMGVHIEACKRSGLTVTAYCKEHGIGKANYYYWHKKLQASPKATDFTAINRVDVKNAGIVMRFPNGIELSFDDNVNTSVLKELVCCI